MKCAYKFSLLFIVLLFNCFSCVQKKENSENFQKEERNELYLFFYATVKEYELREIDETKDYYFVFKETDSNDTLFQFSYFGLNDKAFKQSGYKGFLKIDSFNVAIYDERNLGFPFYKDSLRPEPFPNAEKYIVDNKEKKVIVFNKEGEEVFEMHMLSIGWVKNNVFEVIPSIRLARNDWFKHFK